MKKFIIERMGDTPAVMLEASRFERGEEVITFYDEETSDKCVVVAVFDTHPVTAVYPEPSS
jgi:hypothetical protein